MKNASIKDWEGVLEVVEDIYGIDKEYIIGKSRKKEYIEPRKAVCWLAYNYLKFSNLKIAELLNRNHTTILHSVKTFDKDVFFEKASIQGIHKIEMANNPHHVSNLSPKGKWSRLFSLRGTECEIPTCGFDDVLEIHHLISRKAGGSDHPSNLIILCPNHHRMLHAGILFLNPKKFSFLVIPEKYVEKYVQK